MKLLPHQIIGRDFLVAHDRALLADEMRVGKSVQSIAAVDRLSDAEFHPHVLIICPASLREQWRRQFDRFSVCRSRVHLVVVSYEEAVRDQARLGKTGWDVLIVDEAHYLKSRKAKRTEAVLTQIAPAADRVWCLTGTPAPNNASELWPILHTLFPKTIIDKAERPMNYWQFVRKFCVVRTTPFGEKIEGNKNTEELKMRMAPIMLRRPASILGNTVLPSEMLYLDAAKKTLDELKASVRDELTADVADRLERASAEQADRILEAVESKVKARLMRLVGLAKAPALAALLKDELESGLDKVVVFAWHHEVIQSIVENLNGVDGVVLTGETIERNRNLAVDRFQRDPKCRYFVGNIKAAGVGLDLTASCEAVFAEMSWVPGDNEQASARITGTNQKRAARVRYAVLPGSLDERLVEVNRRKMKDIFALFGARSAA